MAIPVLVDTSCLIAMEHLDILDVLGAFFGSVTITPEVLFEFHDTPLNDRTELPRWMIVASARNREAQQRLLETLDLGEASLIQLALELPESLLVLDDRAARSYARTHGLTITGTLNILVQMKFYFSMDLERSALRQAGEWDT